MLKFWMICTSLAIGSLAQEIPPNYSLYSDQKAKQQEDIITVLIMEDAQANNNTRTETDIDNRSAINLSAGSGKLKGIIPAMGFGLETDSDYDGRGKTSRSGKVKAKVSARIMQVYDNGNLLIEGNKEVEINNETEIIRVSGIIRPEDIEFDNTVLSYKIADARIKYSGKGDTQNAHRPGLFTRFINWIF